MAKRQSKQSNYEKSEKCRIDKWLWAARFFKTRSLASTAIETGKIHVDGQRVKASKEVQIGQVMQIRNRQFEIEVIVTGLSTIRRGAPEAALLYEETPASIAKQAQSALNREVDYAARDRGAGRPTKRQQRDIRKFTGR